MTCDAISKATCYSGMHRNAPYIIANTRDWSPTRTQMLLATSLIRLHRHGPIARGDGAIGPTEATISLGVARYDDAGHATPRGNTWLPYGRYL